MLLDHFKPTDFIFPKISARINLTKISARINLTMFFFRLTQLETFFSRSVLLRTQVTHNKKKVWSQLKMFSVRTKTGSRKIIKKELRVSLEIKKSLEKKPRSQ